MIKYCFFLEDCKIETSGWKNKTNVENCSNGNAAVSLSTGKSKFLIGYDFRK